MNAAMKKKMLAAKKIWTKARKVSQEETPFGEYEDGRYLARLIDADIGESQSSGRLQVAWTWKFMEGENKGNKVFDYDGLENEQNLVWLGRKIVKLGADMPEDLDDLQECLDDIIKSKPLARIRLMTKNDFQNLRIQQLVEDEDLEEDEDTEEEEDESEEEESEDDDEDEDEEEEEEEEDGDEEDEDEDEDETEEEDEDEEEEDEVVELESGMRVTAKIGKKSQVGTVVSVAKNGQTATVRLDAGGDKVKVKIANLTVSDEEEEPAPRKKTSKVRKQTGRK